ncbi:MAG: pyridoxal-phosphate dependent enzyme [Candidatus Promineifilaceae bacterium]
MPTSLMPPDVLAASARLRGVVHRTPVVTSRILDERTGAHIYLKCENFQRVGAFKFRGAYHALSRLSPDERAAGVITHSSGNHAQGVALAARLLGIPATVVMPDNAPPGKRAATAAYGATIVPCEAIEREEVTAKLVAEQGYTLIHPYDNDDIICGQGTAALELFEDVGAMDLLFVPVGGGGLISGSALAAALKSPGCRVIGVEPEIAADANRSWREKRIVELDHVPQTIADGLRTRTIGERNLAVMERYVADMVTVSEDDILASLSFIWNFLKIIVEPSSAVALAPLLSGSYHAQGARVGVLLSGGNIHLPAAEILSGRSGAVAVTPGTELPAIKPVSPPELPRVLILDSQFDLAATRELERVAEVDFRDGLDKEELIGIIEQYQAVIAGPDQWLGAQVIEYGYHLQAIGCAAAKLSCLDVSAAKSLGIAVCYAPGSNVMAIAEDTIARLIQLENRFGAGSLAGKTLGVVGYGPVGRQVAKRAASFDMRILVNQPRLTPELAVATGVEPADLDDLLRRADFVTLHVPHNAETDMLIGVEALALMKPTALIANPAHTDLIDEAALLAALEAGRISGASLPMLPDGVLRAQDSADLLRAHARVIVSPHVTAIIEQQRPAVCASVAAEIAEILQRERSPKTLPLELVPVDRVLPHEETDDKRVERLMARLTSEGQLVNPPITMRWKERYIVLDGATRVAALRRLGCRHLIVQVVDSEKPDIEMHTWYHAIANSVQGEDTLLQRLAGIQGMRLLGLPGKNIRQALDDPRTICYFLDSEGRATLAQNEDGAERLAIMRELVHAYSAWGHVERTLTTDLARLKEQFPHLRVLAVFPQFSPAEVFDAASAGELLPAGLTRFIIPGRILRLNADLDRLLRDEPLVEKRAWFSELLAEKLRRSRFRYYQEPVILLDE